MTEFHFRHKCKYDIWYIMKNIYIEKLKGCFKNIFNLALYVTVNFIQPQIDCSTLNWILTEIILNNTLRHY